MEDTDCGDCYYSIIHVDREHEEPYLRCRRFPPVYVSRGKSVRLLFPLAIARCGEYKSGSDIHTLAETLDQLFPKEE